MIDKTKLLNPNIKGYVLYFYNLEHLESELIPLTSIPPTIKLKKTQELFNTEKVAFYLSGKPVIVLKRGSHISIELQFLIENTKDSIELSESEIKEILKKNPKALENREIKEVLKEVGLTSFEQQKLYGSTAFQSVFRKNILSYATLLTIIGVGLICVLITMLIYSMVVIPSIEVQYIYEYIYIPDNETIIETIKTFY